MKKWIVENSLKLVYFSYGGLTKSELLDLLEISSAVSKNNKLIQIRLMLCGSRSGKRCIME
jgi:hypothetical protein